MIEEKVPVDEDPFPFEGKEKIVTVVFTGWRGDPALGEHDRELMGDLAISERDPLDRLADVLCPDGERIGHRLCGFFPAFLQAIFTPIRKVPFRKGAKLN